MNPFKNPPKLLMLAMGVAMGGAQAAEANVFQQTDLAQGYMLVAENTTTAPATDKTKTATPPAAPATDKAKEAKCGEGKCGTEKSKEGKCGEGKCGASKAKEGKCGEGKCGSDKKSVDTPKEETKVDAPKEESKSE
jgi:uncharacterized low-complexity protein